jgi:hypothetical protein
MPVTSLARHVPHSPPAHANGTSARTRSAAYRIDSQACMGLATEPCRPSSSTPAQEASVHTVRSDGGAQQRLELPGGRYVYVASGTYLSRSSFTVSCP